MTDNLQDRIKDIAIVITMLCAVILLPITIIILTQIEYNECKAQQTLLEIKGGAR